MQWHDVDVSGRFRFFFRWCLLARRRHCEFGCHSSDRLLLNQSVLVEGDLSLSCRRWLFYFLHVVQTSALHVASCLGVGPLLKKRSPRTLLHQLYHPPSYRTFHQSFWCGAPAVPFIGRSRSQVPEAVPCSRPR